MAIVANYKFSDESSDGTATNSSNTAAPDASYAGSSYAEDGSAVFDGAGDYIVIPSDPSFGLNTGTISMDFTQSSSSPANLPWGNPAAHTLFSVDSTNFDAGGHLTVFITSSGVLRVRHQTATEDHYFEGGTITVGAPSSFSYSWGPDGSSLVVNGVETDSGTQALQLAGDVEPIVIGASQAQSGDGTADNLKGFFDGSVSRVRIWDDPMTSSTFVPCFAEGTSIRTDRGNRPVEELRPGDLVVTLDHGLQPLRWVGRSALGPAELARAPNLLPIAIEAGAIGNRAELLLSRQHCVLLPGDRTATLVRVIHLARFGDGRFRIARNRRHITYHHLLFDRHEVIVAQGALAESLYPGREVRTAHADLAAHLASLAPQARARLDRRARPLADGHEARGLIARFTGSAPKRAPHLV